jgi:glutamine amidotransferase
MHEPPARRGAIVVIDYGMGNLRSVWQALAHVSPMGARCWSRLIRRWSALPNAWSFPGRGRCPTACARLTRAVCVAGGARGRSNKPFLGICIGQQMLFEHSEEGDVPGLGVLRRQRPPFSGGRMRAMRTTAQGAAHGLESGHAHCREHPLWAGIADGARFYFVHSYYVAPVDDDCVVGTTDYGIPLPAQWRGIISLPFSATRKRARKRDLPCWPTSLPGSPDRVAGLRLVSTHLSSAFDMLDHSRD